MSAYQSICGYGAQAIASTAGLIDPADGDPVNLGALLALRGDAVDTTTNFDALDRTGNGHTFRQATAADKPTIVNPTELNSQPAFRFDGVSDFLASIKSAATYEFITDGTGFTGYMVLVPRATGGTYRYLSNYTSGGNTGVTIGNDATGIIRYQMFSNIGTFVFDLNPPGGQITLNFGTSIIFSYTEGLAPAEVQLLTGNHVIIANNSVAAPGTNTPAATLNLGRRANGTSYAQFDLAEFAIWNTTLTNAQRVALEYYTLDRYLVS